MTIPQKPTQRRLSGVLAALWMALASTVAPTGAEASDRLIQIDTSLIDTCLAETPHAARRDCIGSAVRECSGYAVDARPLRAEAASVHRACKGSEASHWDRLVTNSYVAQFRKESRRDRLRWILTDSQVAPQIAFAEMHQAWVQL